MNVVIQAKTCFPPCTTAATEQLYFIHTVLYKLLTVGEYSGGTLLDHKSQSVGAP